MLTRVVLEGPMGKEFGREWNLSISGPQEALRLIDANKPGIFTWIRNNLSIYERYRVICIDENGKTENLDNDTYPLMRKLKEIHFVPVLAGAGGGFGQMVFGGVMLAIGLTVPGMQFMVSMGASMMLGGVIQSLSSTPQKRDSGNGNTERKDLTSYYFDGPVNTTQQGVPVALIWGQVLVGSHAISANLSVDQIV